MSQEQLLECLRASGGPVSYRAVYRKLNLSSGDPVLRDHQTRSPGGEYSRWPQRRQCGSSSGGLFHRSSRFRQVSLDDLDALRTKEGAGSRQ